ncbi:MAG: hypothetical protein MZV70_54395 [Desulfobacterales bacterium]|nr:hypothetical protein [Desulfobacterales bacterium]
MNEFRKAREAGLDAVFRVITNADEVTSASKKAEVPTAKVVGMKNQKWLLDTMKEVFGIKGEGAKFYILETPYHNDFLPKDVARSKPSLQWAMECCGPLPDGTPAQCKGSCAVKCMTKVGHEWREERLELDKVKGGILQGAPKVGRESSYDDLVEARSKQIEEFIRRTSLPADKAEEVRGLFEGEDMVDVFGPGIMKTKAAPAPKFGETKPVVPSAPGIKFLKEEKPGAGEKGENRWAPIAKRYGVKTVTRRSWRTVASSSTAPDAPDAGGGALAVAASSPRFPSA